MSVAAWKNGTSSEVHHGQHRAQGRLCRSEHAGCCSPPRGTEKPVSSPRPVASGGRQGGPPGRPAAAGLAGDAGSSTGRARCCRGCRCGQVSPGLWHDLLTGAYRLSGQGGCAPSETHNVVRQVSTCPAAAHDDSVIQKKPAEVWRLPPGGGVFSRLRIAPRPDRSRFLVASEGSPSQPGAWQFGGTRVFSGLATTVAAGSTAPLEGCSEPGASTEV